MIDTVDELCLEAGKTVEIVAAMEDKPARHIDAWRVKH
jgi:hypothetical protein